MAKSAHKVTYSLDMSSFDNSIRGGLYKGEIMAFNKLWGLDFDPDMFIKPLLQMSNEPDDVVEDLPVRKSGDVQTGSGNCCVMYYYCTRIRALEGTVTFYCDGDDTLMFVAPEREQQAL